MRDGADVVEALNGCPGGPELLALASARDDVALVGGAVRDILLERRPRELDVVVADGAAELAGALASRLGILAGQSPDERFESTFHERFRTALLRWSAGQIDIATRRAESYPSPGALPEVREGTVEEDLGRRDFTVNAISVPLGGPHRGELQAPEGALADLAAGRLRVLHDQSFVDDPTRLLRLARYSARLRLQVEEHTAQLAMSALAGDVLRTVSGARIGAELRLGLTEADPLATFLTLSELGVLGAIDSQLRLDEPLAHDALAMLPDDGRPDLMLLASLLLGAALNRETATEAALRNLLDRLEFTAAERDRVIRTVLVVPTLAQALRAASLPSEIHDTLAPCTVEAVALAAAMDPEGPLGAARGNAGEWLARLRHVCLAITGDDLIAAGMPQGPEIGRRLQGVLRLKLDGEIDDGREAELRAALEARV
jgi:tRNA nucleotidyltransferase (CCA-adding enzyme)